MKYMQISFTTLSTLIFVFNPFISLNFPKLLFHLFNFFKAHLSVIFFKDDMFLYWYSLSTCNFHPTIKTHVLLHWRILVINWRRKRWLWDQELYWNAHDSLVLNATDCSLWRRKWTKHATERETAAINFPSSTRIR